MNQRQKVGTIGILMCAVLAFLIVQYDISLALGAVILLGLLALIHMVTDIKLDTEIFL